MPGTAAVEEASPRPEISASSGRVGDRPVRVVTPAPRRRVAFGLTLVVALVGIGLSVGLGVVLKRVHDDNEERLLTQRTLEAAAVLMAAVPSIEAPLAASGEFSEATDGDPLPPFRRLFGPIVEDGRPFVAVSL